MTESTFRGLGLAVSKLKVLVCGELKTMGVRGTRPEAELATERREEEPKGREKNDETERGVEVMLETVLYEKIEELERESLSESTVTIVEVGETRDTELDETIDGDEGTEDGSSAAACRVVASCFRRKRRSLSKVFSELQTLGRNSGSSDSCSSVKYMIAVCGM
jgi:hypothetical protein